VSLIKYKINIKKTVLSSSNFEMPITKLITIPPINIILWKCLKLMKKLIKN